MIYYAIWQKYGALPERFNWQTKTPDVSFYPLRPEFVESTYLLYQVRGSSNTKFVNKNFIIAQWKLFCILVLQISNFIVAFLYNSNFFSAWYLLKYFLFAGNEASFLPPCWFWDSEKLEHTHQSKVTPLFRNENVKIYKENCAIMLVRMVLSDR